MSPYEYICLDCGHDFPLPPVDGEVRCPRCSSRDVGHNQWLLGTPDCEGLAPEDHYYAGLAV